MKPRVLFINLEVKTDVPIGKLKSGLICTLKADKDYVFELIEKPTVNVVRDTKK